jgi:hypothetical protein
MDKRTTAAVERLSKADLRFLMRLLDRAEEEANTEIEIDGDNKAEASSAIKRITRIKLAVIDLDKKGTSY